jgi:hypothetical protein
MGGMQCDVRKDDHLEGLQIRVNITKKGAETDVREIMGYIRRRCMRRMISVRGQQEIARYRLSGVERSPALYTGNTLLNPSSRRQSAKNAPLQTKGNERVSSVILCSLFPGDPG